MLIQLYLYYIGYAWEDIHYSISAASSFIAAIIILLLHKWIPEFILSIIYTGTLVSEPIKKKRKENIKIMVNESKTAPIRMMIKVLKIDRRNYESQIKKWAEFYNYSLKGDTVIVPENKTEEFIELLMKGPPEKWNIF